MSIITNERSVAILGWVGRGLANRRRTLGLLMTSVISRQQAFDPPIVQDQAELRAQLFGPMGAFLDRHSVRIDYANSVRIHGDNQQQLLATDPDVVTELQWMLQAEDPNVHE